MPVSLPPSTNVPWKPDAIAQALRGVKGADAQALVEYMKLLVQHLDSMYSDIAGTVNRLNTVGPFTVIYYKDSQATPHYWSIGIDITGALVTTDLGTTEP